jgi:Protein of unknown function (DUF2917)
MIVSTPTVPAQLVGLSRHEVRAFAGHPGLRIASHRGRVWITQDGDPRDVVIDAGESHALDRDGPVYVQALDAAWVLMPTVAPSAAAGPGLWDRLARVAFSA